MAIPVSASINQLNAEVFLQEGYELSLDAIVPSIELTGSFSPTLSKTQFYIYSYNKTLLYENLNYNANGSYLEPARGTTISNSSSSYNQFELNPVEDVYNQGYSSGQYYTVYNFIDYDLGSELIQDEQNESFNGHPYFLAEISGDRTELRIQNNFLSTTQIKNYYQQFTNKINNRENADEFYISFGNNRNFIGVNSQLELPSSGSNAATSILIKLYKPLPIEFVIDDQLQVITKVGESQVFSVDFQPNLEFIDNLLQLKGPNYNIDIKDKINNSTNYKTLNDLINTNSSESFYQFNSLKDQKGIVLRKNFGDWSEFVKYSSAEQRLNNFYDKMVSIESYNAELAELETITGGTPGSPDYSSSYNNVTNNINKIISKFDSYEYFLYYITGSESWPKYTSTYPYTNYSVTSSAVLDWFGSTNELSAYYNSGKNQIYSASKYDDSNQDYLYYLIPPFITENLNNDQYVKFISMVGQTFDEVYLYTEAIEQVRNTNSGLTGSVLPLGLADEVIESLGYEVGGNSFNSAGFNPNNIGVYPTAGSGLEYIDRYIDIASGSVINYYDQDQSTLGYVIALADPSFPYPLDNASQEIYKRIFHNMVSLVKRKGTVTGLRQLINIWGVPNTMLRISEFGGKNKDDENDYDLWMNRYSNALTTYNYKKGALLPSGSIRIPWTPLTANYVQTATPPDIAVPDCIQFRFKNEKPIATNSLFTSSLLVKNHLNSINYSDFGIVLQYSGSNSGSYSGSVLPTDYQYGTMQFIISGSVAEGAKSPGYFESDPITLPFFDGGWWSVQLQRKTHLSASNQNNNINEYELKVANNIYDGYDGNQIGFQGSTSITMPDSKVTQSINEAWNKFSMDSSLPSARGVILGGYMTWPNASGLNNTIVGGSGGRSLGTGFSGSFQEFRYYRRAMSASSFNDYVMNPESIQGHSDSNTGEGSSYDLLSYRLPLGNELEYINMSGSAGFTTATENTKAIGILKFGGTPNVINFPSFGANALGSVHPSLVNKKGSLYTSSFLYMTNYNTGSGYTIVYQGWDGTDTAAVTASYLAPNTQINYMDQPAAGLRNRIKNKIQVIDGNEYGTILSPFRSIQQEFEQSGSYTEDINSLEVGFSFQNEINDDIIGTFGHGVVSDAIADPRFISESSDRYPELTRIAEDYFKKYQGTAITDPTYNGGLPTIIEKEFDYNRLIKFYETSLFKAIKNYVPARTSLSTGIIVKQHLLERNKAPSTTGISINTPIAKTPETGSDVYGYTDQTGFNSVISQRNLLITSSINMYSLTGSAGGSVNKYNVITNEGQFFKNESDNLLLTEDVLTALYPDLPPASAAQNIKIFTDVDYENKVYVQSEVAFRSQLRFNGLLTGSPTNPVDIKFEATSSKRGGIFDTTFDIGTAANPPGLVSDNYMEIYPDERIYWNVMSIGDTTQFSAYIINFGENDNFTKPEPSASQQVNWYIDNFTGEYKVDDHQTEFYDGEFSGSEFRTIPAQYNPYRIYADGTNLNPDQTPTPGAPTLNLNNGSHNATRFPSVSNNGPANVDSVRQTGSLLPLGAPPFQPISGSASGGNSSDAFLFRSTGGSSSDTQRLTIKSSNGTTITYVAIGTGSPLYSLSANGKTLLSEETNFLSLYSDVSVSSVPSGTGTESITLSNGSKSITADVSFAGGAIGNATITNNNADSNNSANWPSVGDNFSGTLTTAGGVVVTFTLTQASVTNGLLQTQFLNSGTSAGTSVYFVNAVEGSNGHGSIFTVSSYFGQGQAGNLFAVTLKETSFGANNNINADGSISGAGDFSNNTTGICLATDTSPSTYAFPNQFTGGADQLATSTNFLPNNAGAITGLVPGANYQLDFTISGYSFDNLGGDGKIGLSAYASNQVTLNGVDESTSSRNSSGNVSTTWTQADNTYDAIFFAEPGVDASITSITLTVLPDRLAKKHLWNTAGYLIEVTESQIFQNSSYNPIINNISGSRENENYLDMDFDSVEPGTTQTQFIPNDYTLTVSASQLGFEGTATNDSLLEFSTIPESNYTILSSANPRYNGTLIQSADYNFYTGIPSASRSPLKSAGNYSITPRLLAQNKVKFINGETGSWDGDKTYGRDAVIDSRPFNIAHFKQSYENKSIFNTTTFVIDQLIEIPFEEILTEQSPIISSSVIDGSNENLIPVSSTFVVNRGVTAYYNDSTRKFREFDITLNYSTLNVGSNPVFAPASDFKTYFSNQPLRNQISNTINVTRPTWLEDSNADTIDITNGNGSGRIGPDEFEPTDVPIGTTLFQKSGENGKNGMISSSITNVLITGSSVNATNRGYGILHLRGPSINFITSTNIDISVNSSNDTLPTRIVGPSLLLMNTINQNTLIGPRNANPTLPTSTGFAPNPEITAELTPPLITTLGFSGLSIPSTFTPIGEYLTGSFFGTIPFVPQEKMMGEAVNDVVQASPVGRIVLPIINNKDAEENYFRINLSSSKLPEYERLPDERFIVEPGDEIRIAYQVPSQVQDSTGVIGEFATEGVFEIVEQDFKVIEYELYPPTMFYDVRDLPNSLFTPKFWITCSALITSSAPQHKDNPFQIDEYKKRLEIAVENGTNFFLMGDNGINATADGMGSGSFISDIKLNDYVVNLDGENRPTKLNVEIQRSLFRYPDDRTPSSGKNWVLGTNCSGLNGNNGITNGSLTTPDSNAAPSDEFKNQKNPCQINYQIGPYLHGGQYDVNELPCQVPFDPGYVYDKLVVYPDPSTLAQPIPSGSILSATFRKRIEDDSKVIVNLTQPSGSRGIQTPSGDGYLIPTDLSDTQQRNVQKIINKLQSENVFLNSGGNDEV